MTIPKYLQVEDYNTSTWTCKLCKKRVNKQPSECKGVEPVWWWWCDQCRVKNKGGHGNAGTTEGDLDKRGIERFMYKQF